MLLSLEPRGRQSRWMLLASPLLAGLLTLVCGALLFACLGHDPWQTLHTVLVQPLSDLYGLGELLVKAMPILLCALGLALAYQARVWNIGAEGQLLVGALAGSAVAIQLLDWQSRWALAWVLLAGTAAGALWAGFAAWLRTRFNANEILTTIMLNYIALNLLLYGVHGPLKDPDGFNFPQSALFGEASRLPALFEDSRVHLGALFGLLALAAVWVLAQRSFLGFQVRVLGLDRRTAGFVGFREKRLVWFVLLFSGALAGLAGVCEVAGPIGADVQRFAVLLVAAGESDETTVALGLRERFGAPARLVAAAVRDDPDLEDPGGLGFQVVFRMDDAGTGAHHLHVAGLGAALVAQAVLVGDRAFADIGNDLHVAVRVRREAAAGGDLVIVPDPQAAPVLALRVIVVGEGKMMTRVQPAVVGMAQTVEGTTFDHDRISIGPVAARLREGAGG